MAAQPTTTAAGDPPDGDRGLVEHRRLRVTGTVQGVGFRPFVYRVATGLGLTGEVSNGTAGVTIDAEGTTEALDALLDALRHEPPPLARVTDIDVGRVALHGYPGFRIVPSDDDGTVEVPVSVDVGPCGACLAELSDPADRRFGHPFINCTDCGPRYTITRRVPYDRPVTTMAGFPMCEACRSEYDDPADRRFHAQPVCCPACGPQLALLDPAGGPVATRDEALAGAVRRLREGAILAVKGVGGFHLAVDAGDEGAVARLRRRKSRDDKPFAVLVADVEEAAALVALDEVTAGVLVSPRRPIVLAARRPDAPIAGGIAPGLPELGVMLPPSPLHHLLVTRFGRPLVLTSGNLSDEPIAYTDDDAIARLGPMVDAVLTHDRPIHIRCDDAVVRAGVAGGPQPVRRSRGFAPEPLPLPRPARRTVLAVGAELKSTVAVASGSSVVVSHHLGDLEHAATHQAFRQAVEHLLHLRDVDPEVVAHDLHPEYLSTKFALDLDVPLLGVQHHHAHIASCLAEHGEEGRVVGIAYDGLGWGTDGTAWGGEFLVCDLDGFERAGHLRPVPLPGGAAAIREPWRMAVSWAAAALDDDALPGVLAPLDARWAEVVALAASPRVLATTSAGRLFDAVAALLGVRSVTTYEGQAAIELEALARQVAPSAAACPPVEVRVEDGRAVLDPAPLVRAVVDAVARGEEPARTAAGFHRGLATGTIEIATAIAADRGLDTVALSGGVFQNARLTELVAGGLEDAGLRVLTHRLVPPNDGGISFGQAAIAAR
jgi:hydrogenase maturation protein HypF